jgi:putative methyltransferase (TIGR04325 family)
MAIRYEIEIERAPRSPDLIITSGALQYLSAPYEMIARFAAMSPKYVFIDRLPVAEITDDFLTIQHVPGRYFADGERRDVPAWWFSRKGFFEALENRFVIEWTAQTGEHTEVHDIPVQLEAAMLRLR